MPDSEDPRYRGSGPPSLEQLRALLLNATVESFRSPDGKYSEIRFRVDNQKLYDSGYSYRGTDSQIHAGFIGIMDRITEFEDITKRYADNITGVTCDDMIAQFRHELTQINPRAGLMGALLSAMYENGIKKMEELKEWRRAADQKRREREQAQREQMRREREQREREAEIERERQRAEVRWQQRRKEREEQQRRESAAGSDPGAKSRQDSSFEQEFRDAFGMGYAEWSQMYQNAMGGGAKGPFEDLFRRAYGGRYRSHFHGHSEQQKKEEPKRPKARNKTREPWYVVLNVPATASKEEIQKAYRRLASKYHPDRYKEADATEKMADINTARDEGLR